MFRPCGYLSAAVFLAVDFLAVVFLAVVFLAAVFFAAVVFLAAVALALDLIEKNNLHDASPFLAAVAVATRGNHGDGVRQESHLAGALDGVGDVMLMLRASASDATGLAPTIHGAKLDTEAAGF